MEIFRDLHISIDPDRMAAIADLIDRSAPPGWSRDRAAEEQVRSAPVSKSRPTFCFNCSQDGWRPAATVILTQKDPGTFFVSNIVPHSKHQLAHGEYNAIMEEFCEGLIWPHARQVGGAVRLGSWQADLEHWMPHDAAELLRQFSASANKGTGSAHPADRDRWNAFVVAAHRDGSTMDASDLRRWLTEVGGWAPEVADQLAVEYEYGRELLDFAAGRRRSARDMPSIDVAEAQLRAGGRSVLFLDTCVLLDIIRATLRCLGTNFVQSAIELRGLLSAAPPGCVLVVASMVPTEWNNHAPKTRDEVRGHLAKIQDQAGHFHEACRSLGISLGYGVPAYPAVSLHDRLFDLSQEILSRAVGLDPDGGCATRAIGRVVANLPPSRQGGEMKDCVIVEECLELTRRLRENGFVRKCVFCTSNTNDYGAPHPKLATDFAAVNLTFTNTLPWAVHEIST